MRRVLVTGGTGFIGAKIVTQLLKLETEITLVLRPKSKVDPAIAASRISIAYSDDLFSESESWWQAICVDIDTIIHTAWYTDPQDYQVSPLNEICRDGTLVLGSAARRMGVKRFIGVGTCAEYKQSSDPLTTQSALSPSTPYASAKAATYEALMALFADSSTSFAWCRIFYTYGEGEHPSRLYQYLLTGLESGEKVFLGDGGVVRDFLEVSDVARQIVLTATSGKVGAVNICSGKGITIRQFAEDLADKYGSRSQLQFDTRPKNSFDPPFVVGQPEAF